MGCDIHPHYEVMSADGWKYHDYRAPCVTGHHPDGSEKIDYSRMFDDPLDIGRCYDLFAFLADVRNEGNIEPIAPPRGLPDDAATETRKHAEYWEADGHSHSWFSLSELKAAASKVSAPVTRWGLVSAAGYRHFKETGAPNGWCKGSSAEVVSNEEMDRRIEAGSARGCMTQIEWSKPLGWGFGGSLSRLIEGMSALGSDECVRVVFWFDN